MNRSLCLEGLMSLSWRPAIAASLAAVSMEAERFVRE